jgi:hypothetical protein
MATGTVSLHSWNDGAESDEALPPISSNYNARLDPRTDFDDAMRRAREPGSRNRAAGRGLRSSVVRPTRYNGGEEDDDGDGGGGW